MELLLVSENSGQCTKQYLAFICVFVHFVQFSQQVNLLLDEVVLHALQESIVRELQGLSDCLLRLHQGTTGLLLWELVRILFLVRIIIRGGVLLFILFEGTFRHLLGGKDPDLLVCVQLPVATRVILSVAPFTI